LITHPLLDVFTSYGTQLLAPLSNRRFALDGLSIIDPIYTTPLILSVVLWRLRGTISQKVAIAALVFTTSYALLGYAQSRSVVARAEAALAAEGFDATKVRALPTLMNNIAFRVVAVDAARTVRVAYASSWVERPLSFVSVRWPDDPRVRVALDSWHGGVISWFADGFVSARVEEGGWVRFSDQRYAMMSAPTSSLWGAEMQVDAAGQVTQARRWDGQRGAAMEGAFGHIWHLATMGEPPALSPTTTTTTAEGSQAEGADEPGIPAAGDL
jgi:inner membrane protein